MANQDQTQSDPQFRAELLARLGLPDNAGPGHIEAAYRSSVAVLERLPDEQQGWAQGQRAELDAIRSLLLEAPAAAPSPAPKSASVDADVVAPRSRRTVIMVLGGAAVAVIIGVVAFILLHGKSAVPGITGTPTNTANPSASASLNMQAVAADMQKISKNPKDFTALMDLAGLYFQAGDYANSVHFSQEASTANPKSDAAWVAVGAGEFNLGKNTEAKAAWEKAIALNPKSSEAYYDLGFYYLSGSTPNLAMVKQMWEKVVSIDPKSTLAQNVKTHLTSLEKNASSSPSPTASGK